MDINKALELGLEWAEKRMASELTELDREYILTGIKASLVKNCSIPDVSQQRELLIAYRRMLDFDIQHEDIDESVGYFLNHKESYL